MTTTCHYWGLVSKCCRAVGIGLAILSLSAIATPIQAQTKLIDPETKHVIGTYDKTKKVLVLPKRNLALPRKRILRVSDRDYKLLMQRCTEMKASNLKYFQNPPSQMQTSTGDWNAAAIIVDGITTDQLPPAGARGHSEPPASDKCVALCWYMAEGGASCQGCCVPVSKDACTCWEECTDSMSSIAK